MSICKNGPAVEGTVRGAERSGSKWETNNNSQQIIRININCNIKHMGFTNV